ncbi:carboxypeptidase B [Eupeodes corollae]|uniref:carboxypeptidase B n=1 Tax=Eupeodes corollae TaxID=290404 RepID=UPI0024902767|nr:carboxypeptidase B [Eupeodes corollae]
MSSSYYNKPDVTTSYLRHKEINDYLDYLRHRYADVVKVYNIGRSYEGRLIKAIQIDWHKRYHHRRHHRHSKLPLTMTDGSGNTNVSVPKKNVVFIEAGTHAREWMTIAVALKCIQQLTEKHNRHRKILEKLRFFIIPLVNPDGYEYTYNKNRMWRKNRRPHSILQSIGTDCNRNFDFHWENGSTKASRSTYKGEKPFSEPETCALRNIMEKLQPHLLLFFSLHSYGQAIMYPWGYTKELPISWKEHQQLAECGKKAIKKVSGRVYRCGSISGIRKHIYSGSIVDYAFGIVKVPFALVMELPSNELGFQPSPVHIRPIGHESWIGIRAMCQKALDISVVSILSHEGNQNQNQNQDQVESDVVTEVTPPPPPPTLATTVTSTVMD